MIIQSAVLTHFRNHRASSIRLAPHVNALFGRNGQGKTNLLEALSFVGLTKSFYAAADRTVLEIGAPFFEIEAVVCMGGGHVDTVCIRYDAATAVKTYTVNAIRPERLADVIGRFPVVVLSPEHEAITGGGPADRRRWMDLLLSQVSPAYLEDLLEYRRVLHQRNRLLLDARLSGRPAGAALAPWTENLVRHGTVLMERRERFVREFAPAFRNAYAELGPDAETAEIAYLPSSAANGSNGGSGGEGAFRAALERRSAEESRRGATLVGPHRDDLAFTLTGLPVQTYASQGQQKTFLVALKMAEFVHLEERREETPVFLLDDLFGELDAFRAAAILRRLERAGQCIITATDEQVFGGTLVWSGRNGRFDIAQGTCTAA
jgi:DNA replication and repair protein RecF